MKNRILVFCFILLFLGVVSAEGQLVVANYNFSNDTNMSAEISFSSVLLRVSTFEDSVCKYSSTKGFSYLSGSSFDSTGGVVHRKTFTGLSDGTYKYYVKCSKDGSSSFAELEVTIRVNSLVSAKISLSGDVPLREGNYEVNLVTSKEISGSPGLSYSFDGIVYNPLALSGLGTTWKGYLVVDDEVENGAVSFKFSASDLEGRIGNEITSGSLFEVDTVKPSVINTLIAESHEGYVKLEWYFEEDYDFFRVYRSKDSNPDYTDYYRSVDNDVFSDSYVDDGETYYYRIAAVDDAGNEGELSNVVHGTVLFDENEVDEKGLSADLISNVNNFLVEVDSVLEEVQTIENGINLKSKDEIYLFSLLGFDDDISGVKSELSSLRRDVEKYKLQDLSFDELDKKLNSAELKLNIIQKKIPEDITIIDSGTSVQEINEDVLYDLIYELDSFISEDIADKSVKKSLEFAKESGLRISSDYYVVGVLYADGSSSKFSVVDRRLDSQFERAENYYFVEVIPKSVVESASDINVNNLNYEVVKDDPVLSFATDTKSVSYVIEKELDIESLKESMIGFVYLAGEDENVGITSYFFVDSSFGKYAGFFSIVFVVVGGFVFYFFYKKKNNFSELYFQTINKVDEGLSFLKGGDDKKAESVYGAVKSNYLKLNVSEKKSIYNKIESLRRDILIFRMERQLELFKKSPSIDLLNKLKTDYKTLPLKNQKKLSKVIESLDSNLNDKGEEKPKEEGEKKDDNKSEEEKKSDEKE